MSNVINIYCDESCHLEKDKSPVMVLGSVWAPHNKIKTITSEIRDRKEKHGFSRNFEFKWTQIYPAKMDFYLEALDRQVKKKNENPSVGIILCSDKNEKVSQRRSVPHSRSSAGGLVPSRRLRFLR